MKRSIVNTALIAAAVLLSSSLSFAVESKPGTAGETKAISAHKVTGKSAKAKAAAKVKPVDINSASKAALMKLPGVTAAIADKIIAGRPYNTKARLVTEKIITIDTYGKLTQLIYAKQ